MAAQDQDGHDNHTSHTFGLSAQIWVRSLALRRRSSVDSG